MPQWWFTTTVLPKLQVNGLATHSLGQNLVVALSSHLHNFVSTSSTSKSLKTLLVSPSFQPTNSQQLHDTLSPGEPQQSPAGPSAATRQRSRVHVLDIGQRTGFTPHTKHQHRETCQVDVDSLPRQKLDVALRHQECTGLGPFKVEVRKGSDPRGHCADTLCNKRTPCCCAGCHHWLCVTHGRKDDEGEHHIEVNGEALKFEKTWESR